MRKLAIAVIAFTIYSFWGGFCHAQSVTGLLVYMEPPISPLREPECIPFTAIRKAGAGLSDLTTSNGAKREVKNVGIIGTVLLPPAARGPETAQQAAAANLDAQRIIGQFPSVRRSVNSVLDKWKLALQKPLAPATPAPAAPPVAAPPTPPASVLTVQGVPYTNPSLSSVEGLVAIVQHDSGITRIPFSELSQRQIASLNAGSASALIDPRWEEIEKVRAAEQEAESARRKSLAKVIPPPRLSVRVNDEHLNDITEVQMGVAKIKVVHGGGTTELDIEKIPDIERARLAGVSDQIALWRGQNGGKPFPAPTPSPASAFATPAPPTVDPQYAKEAARQFAEGQKRRPAKPPEEKRRAKPTDLLADEPMVTGAWYSILGTWRFADGATRTFAGNADRGTLLNAAGEREASWVSRWASSGSMRSFEIFQRAGDEKRAIIDLKDSGYLVGTDQNGKPIRANKVGCPPKENSLGYSTEEAEKERTNPLALVDKDFLRLVRCVNHPWTDDPAQAAACGAMPKEETDCRLDNYNGGNNPATRALMLEIQKRQAAVASARQARIAALADVDNQLDRTRSRSTIYITTNGIGRITTQREVQTGTTISDYLDYGIQSWAADGDGKYRVAVENGKLAAQYRQTVASLVALAPKMYGASEVLPRIVAVHVTGNGFVVENVSGYNLSNLTVRVDIHSGRDRMADDFRLFYSPMLRPGEKRYSSALMLSQVASTQPNPLARIKMLKVTAWAREARQNEERVEIGMPQSSEAAPGGILELTRRNGETVRATFARLEGTNVIVTSSVGESLTIPLSDLDDASQAQARKAAGEGTPGR